ncbi:MAG: hypothetical protein ACOCVA_03005 [Prolixibacteraceae bacterium]
MKNTVTLLFLTFLFSVSTFSQKAPFKIGKVSKKELKQEYCSVDSSASAAVLYSYGHFRNRDYNFIEKRRIKIFKQEGTSYGDFVTKGGRDVSVRGFTSNLVDGKVEKTRLRNKSVFRERITDDRYRYRVAMPDVKAGSVIDIEITYPWLQTKWYFQEDIPVMHSELYIESSRQIDFRKNLTGTQPLEKSSTRHWIAKNMPAFKSEPYLSSKENYITKIEFDVLRVSIPGFYKSFTTDWEAANDLLLEDEDFGGALRSGTRYLKNAVEEISTSLGKDASDLEKIKAAYEKVKQIKWNNEIRFYPSSNMLSSTYKDGVGNSSDINLILIQLLQELEVPAAPVVTSTRKNGFMNPFFPSLEKLNYVIACAFAGEEQYLLDATEQMMPFGLLPQRCLNEHGRLISSNRTVPIDIKPQGSEKELVLYNLKLDEKEMKFTGNRVFQGTEYAAFKFRNNFMTQSSKENYISKVESDNSGLNITNLEIENPNNPDKPVKASFQLEMSNNLDQVQDMLFLNPFFMEQLKENPFKLDDRKYPVDFAYKREKNAVINIELPENIEISELPESQNLALPENTANARILYGQTGNILSIQYQFRINKTLFLPEEYTLIQQFYDEVIAKQAEPIILAKKDNKKDMAEKPSGNK